MNCVLKKGKSLAKWKEVHVNQGKKQDVTAKQERNIQRPSGSSIWVKFTAKKQTAAEVCRANTRPQMSD